MKTFKNFLTEAKQIKVGDKVKSKNSFASTNNVKGEVVDIETVKFASGDQIRYKVKELDGSITDLRADDIVKESLSEAISVDREFMKLDKMASDIKNMAKDAARDSKMSKDRGVIAAIDNVEDSVEELKKSLDKLQTRIKSGS